MIADSAQLHDCVVDTLGTGSAAISTLEGVFDQLIQRGLVGAQGTVEQYFSLQYRATHRLICSPYLMFTGNCPQYVVICPKVLGSLLASKSSVSFRPLLCPGAWQVHASSWPFAQELKKHESRAQTGLQGDMDSNLNTSPSLPWRGALLQRFPSGAAA